MSTLQFLVCVTSVALVASKFLDCWSTASQMDGIDDETNPLARAAMQRFGPGAAIWGVFGVVLLIVAIVGGSAYWGAGELAAALPGSAAAGSRSPYSPASAAVCNGLSSRVTAT